MSKMFGSYAKSTYLCTRFQENHSLTAWNRGSVAQLNRASDYGSEGCGFESRRNHKERYDYLSFLFSCE